MIKKTTNNKLTKVYEKPVIVNYDRITRRSGYYWCNSCNCNTCHIIFSDSNLCLSCNKTVTFTFSPKEKTRDIEQPILLLL